MAVPGRRNGWVDDDDEDYNGGEAVGLFEEDGLVELEPDTPPHLRDLAAAAQLGDVENLRRALGIFLFDHHFLDIHVNSDLKWVALSLYHHLVLKRLYNPICAQKIGSNNN